MLNVYHSHCRGQCSSDTSIAVGYSHSGVGGGGEGGSYAVEDLQDQVAAPYHYQSIIAYMARTMAVSNWLTSTVSHLVSMMSSICLSFARLPIASATSPTCRTLLALQTSAGSKRTAEALGPDLFTSIEDLEDAKRLDGRMLSQEERLERRQAFLLEVK